MGKQKVEEKMMINLILLSSKNSKAQKFSKINKIERHFLVFYVNYMFYSRTRPVLRASIWQVLVLLFPSSNCIKKRVDLVEYFFFFCSIYFVTTPREPQARYDTFRLSRNFNARQFLYFF